MYFSEINYIAVVLGGIISMILGFLWYGPLFAKPWMALVGISKEKLDAAQSSAPKTYLVSFISATIMSAILYWIVKTVAPFSLTDGALLGLMMWSGFTAYPLLNNTLYTLKPFRLFLIDSGYYLVLMVINAMIYTIW